MAALKAVAKFIKEKGLIIYGGMAIDANLKNANKEGIYDDSVEPDYDCLSHEFVDDILSLKAIIDDLEPGETSQITRARHSSTFRLKYKESYICDISYLPPDLQINSIERDGLKYVDVTFLIKEIYSTFSKPFLTPGYDDVEYRFDKTFTRYNKLMEIFERPKVEGVSDKTCKVKLKKIKNGFYTGFSMIVLYDQNLELDWGDEDIVNVSLPIETPVEIATTDIDAIAKELELTEFVQYKHKLMDNVPAGYVGEKDGVWYLI